MVKINPLFITVLLFLVTIIAAFSANFALAQENISEEGEFNPNAVFWPLAAGKTIEDPLYFLKELKENARGWIVFGAGQKANYQTTLVTKRLFEVEKLLKENKKGPALKTIDKGLKQLNEAGVNIEKARKEKTPAPINIEMTDRLQKTKKYLVLLEKQADEETKQKLMAMNDQIEKLLQLLK